ncbi:hypothetical protein AVEN_126236-1 [Araneus ventricosus]|uniref:Uncharacterized protein n=1 Tax=Araneus ventricosus TaxID=182803 RepID=A0A4Y2SLA3_ARAVE|nr:hypothetical protein AVEN_126236-1 [Araneus ventricosus]
MAPNLNFQRRKRQRDAKRDIEKFRKDLLKKGKQQKKQQERDRKKQQNNERSAILTKKRCKRCYENKKQKTITAEAAAANLLSNEGASISTGSFTMSSGLGLPLPNYSVECLRELFKLINISPELLNYGHEIFTKIFLTLRNNSHDGLVAGPRLRDRKIPGSKPDSPEDPPCIGPAAH